MIVMIMVSDLFTIMVIVLLFWWCVTIWLIL